MAHTTTGLKVAVAPDDSAADAKHQLRLLQDGFLNYTSPIVTAMLALAVLPVVYHGLGAEQCGVWVAALALSDFAGILNFGVGRSVSREVASGMADAAFVRSAGVLHAGIGVAAAIVIAVAGIPLAAAFGLSGSNAASARAVFVIVTAAVIADQVAAWAFEVLTGLRRFGRINGIVSCAAIVRSVLFAVAIYAGARILTIAFVHVAVSVATAVVAVFSIRHWAPELSSGRPRFDWAAVRPHARFGALSQAAAVSAKLMWQMGPVIAGVFLGARATADVYVAQRFPLAIWGLHWRAAEPVYPTASALANDIGKTLRTGTRWLSVSAIGAAAIFWVIAPGLLHSWLGTTSPELLWVFRLTLVAVTADIVAASAVQVLWARAKLRMVVTATIAATAIALVFAALMLPRYGIVAVAAALCCGILPTAAAYFIGASRLAQRSTGELFLGSVLTALPPAAVAAFATLGVVHFTPVGGWVSIVYAALAGSLAFGAALFVFSSHDDRQLLRATARWVISGPWAMIRLLFHRLPGVRSATWGCFEAGRILIDFDVRSRAAFDHEFEEVDPFRNCDAREQARFATELRLLAGRRFRRTLEIGCAEGSFTELLAASCDDLLAVDFNEVALSRARQRCGPLPNVRFSIANLRSGTLPEGPFDLIVASGILEYLLRPWQLRRALRCVIDRLTPHGYLLLTVTAAHPFVEKSWWGRLLRRGIWINREAASSPEVEVVAELRSEYLLAATHTLLRKTSVGTGDRT
jgi:O-antigen/teichoic acid export membrane protein/SAM-dependent methyltransferase